MAVQKPDTVSVTINNWEKFNGRKDVKRTSWFRVDYALLEDPDFYDFTHEEFKAWLYVLAQACRKMKGTVTLSFRHAEATARISRAGLTSALEKLQELQIVHADVTRTLRAPKVTDTDSALTDRQTDITGQTDANVDEHVTRTLLVLEPEKKPGKAGKGGETNPAGASPTALVWRAYRDAYKAKYGEAPPWNAKTAGQLTSFVSRIPAADAPEVAAFYLTHAGRYYAEKMHPVWLLLQDAEKLRTEWVTGRRMTGTQARMGEKVSHAQDQLARIARGEL